MARKFFSSLSNNPAMIIAVVFCLVGGCLGNGPTPISTNEAGPCTLVGISSPCEASAIIASRGWTYLPAKASKEGSLTAFRINITQAQLLEQPNFKDSPWFTVVPLLDSPNDITEWGVLLMSKSPEGLALAGLYATGEALRGPDPKGQLNLTPASFDAHYITGAFPNFDESIGKQFLLTYYPRIEKPGEAIIVVAARGKPMDFEVAIRPQYRFPDGLLIANAGSRNEVLDNISKEGFSAKVTPFAEAGGYHISQFGYLSQEWPVGDPEPRHHKEFVKSPDFEIEFDRTTIVRGETINLTAKESFKANAGFSQGSGFFFSTASKGKWSVNGAIHGLPMRGQNAIVLDGFPLEIAEESVLGLPGFEYANEGQGDSSYLYKVQVVEHDADGVPLYAMYANNVHFGTKIQEFLGAPLARPFASSVSGYAGNIPPSSRSWSAL